ncbi:MAG: MarR family winged helix-turn-helix transcriptional regulator [Acidimicrobiia bacterium]
MKSKRVRSSEISSDDYAQLLEFRDGLRRFLHWSEEQARSVGLTAAQHQLLLAVRGHPHPPSIAEVADHLLLRHHSVVELANRAEAAGLIERYDDGDDQRVVRLRLSRTGAAKLAALSAAHLEEIDRMGGTFSRLSRGLG